MHGFALGAAGFVDDASNRRRMAASVSGQVDALGILQDFALALG